MKRITWCLIIGYCVALVIIGVYVPWNTQFYVANGKSHHLVTNAAEFDFIWNPPKIGSTSWASTASIDMKRISVEFIIISVIAGVLIFATRKNNTKPKSTSIKMSNHMARDNDRR